MRELFRDYEPDYDALWQEFVDLDEQAIFYATHEQEDCPMTDIENPAGKVAGYTAQPDAKVALVNEFKADEERLLRKLDKMSNELLFTLGKNEMRMAPLIINHEYDQGLLDEARKTLRIGFILLNRAVLQPQRIRLPEDSE